MSFEMDASLIHPDSQVADLDDIFTNEMMKFQDEDTAYSYHRQVGLGNLLFGPILIMKEFLPIITIALCARLVHFIIDLISPTRTSMKNLITCLFGYYQLASFFDRINLDSSKTLQTFLFTVIVMQLTYAMIVANLFQVKETRGIKFHAIYMLLIYSPILINEYLIHHKTYQQFSLLRSMFMTLSMKVSSTIEFTKSPKPSKDPLTLLAYLLHPASSIFGPWHSLEGCDMEVYRNRLRHLQVMSRMTLQVYRSFVQLAKAFLLMVVLELISQFSSDDEFPSTIVDKISKAYFVAQSFRFSHYSTCYISTGLLTLWSNPEKNPPEICKPSEVEFPRSLVQVVVSWNIAMHTWLKDYVFDPLKHRTSSIFITIFCTYLISSILHGFKFNIWSVLLTLGIMSWIEHRVRSRLAHRLNACILARPCPVGLNKTCARGHTRTARNSPIVMLINLIFRIIAMYHLAYLGSIFKGNYDERDYGDALASWSELYFSSHLMTIFAFFVTLIGGK